MSLVHPAGSAAKGGTGGSARMLTTVALSLVALVCVEAATAAPRSTAGTRSLCTTAKSVAHNLVDSTSLSANASATPARLKVIYTAIVNAEPALLGSASGTIKTDLSKVLVFVNVVDADLKKANWHASALAPQLPTLSAQARKVAPPLHTLEAYLHTTCHLDV